MTRPTIFRLVLCAWAAMWLARAATHPTGDGMLMLNVGLFVGISAGLGYWSKR